MTSWSVEKIAQAWIELMDQLAPYGVYIRMFPGGHLATSEHPLLLAEYIRELAATHRVGQATNSLMPPIHATLERNRRFAASYTNT